MADPARVFASLLLPSESGVASFVGAGGKTTLMFRLARELAHSGKRVLTTTTTRIYRPEPDQCRAVFCSRSPKELVRAGRALLGYTPHCTLARKHLYAEGKLEGVEPGTVEELFQAGLFDWILVEADGAARKPLKAHAEHEPAIPGASTDVIGLLGLDGLGVPLDASVAHRPEVFSRTTGLPLGAAVTERALAEILTSVQGLFRSSPPACRRSVFLNKAEGPELLQAGERLTRSLASSGLFHAVAAGSLRYGRLCAPMGSPSART
jgi:probable selenium-dependent hydroxylase accessory protein YqeC